MQQTLNSLMCQFTQPPAQSSTINSKSDHSDSSRRARHRIWIRCRTTCTCICGPDLICKNQTLFLHTFVGKNGTESQKKAFKVSLSARGRGTFNTINLDVLPKLEPMKSPFKLIRWSGTWIQMIVLLHKRRICYGQIKNPMMTVVDINCTKMY